MKFDLHTHHVRCGHASGNIEDYIQSGDWSRGLDRRSASPIILPISLIDEIICIRASPWPRANSPIISRKCCG